MKRTNGGAQWWSEDKSFYVVLLLCLAAIAVAAYLLFAVPSGTTDETMQAEEYQADDSVTASEALERIPAMDPQPAEKQQESETQTEEAEQTEQPVQQTAAALTVAPPMDSEVTQDFSQDTLTYNETTGDWRTHEAIDYAGKKGDAVQAAADGTVLAVGEDAVLGKYLTISHVQGFTSLYAGITDPTVSEGDSVTQGQKIAVLGDPMPLEEKQGVHLHFAILADGEEKNPNQLY
ncbi:peptidoglycan DD-metalloendopeptidase family protein [Butyricicoccus sp.]|uniref:peptidoglycan DD-metalloendopeptidase family protein n=1 Tax=Butyricicoccus sp. TaxID=2049021 RepID=UPI003D7DBE4D